MDTVFNSPKAYFLTFKGKGKAHQKIDYVSKMIKKISNNYYIVREKNKMTEGYHFHAIFIMITKPKASWFKKGCHINLQKVGKGHLVYTAPLPQYPPPVNTGVSARDIDESHDAVEHSNNVRLYEDQIITKCIKDAGQSLDRLAHVQRTLKYMAKEQEFPIQYTDYVYAVHGKNVKLD